MSRLRRLEQNCIRRYSVRSEPQKVLLLCRGHPSEEPYSREARLGQGNAPGRPLNSKALVCDPEHIGSFARTALALPRSNDRFLGLLVTRSMVDDHRRSILSSSCAISRQANYQHHLWFPRPLSGVGAVPLCGSERAQANDAPRTRRTFRACPLWALVMRSEQSSPKRQA
jgi:hypothetical protein